MEQTMGLRRGLRATVRRQRLLDALLEEQGPEALEEDAGDQGA